MKFFVEDFLRAVGGVVELNFGGLAIGLCVQMEKRSRLKL
jgi:hypothetical protein